MKRAIALLMILLSVSGIFASEEDPVFALVLSGGGATGLTHIPIIQELDKRGIVPDMVVGTSMGALLGGLYAAGYDGEDLEYICRTADLNSAVYNISPMRSAGILPSAFDTVHSNVLNIQIGDEGIGTQMGILNDEKVNSLLSSYLAKVLHVTDFDDLPIPFRCVGTDIMNRRTIVFGSGSLFDAMRASMAIPLVFSPVILDDGSVVIDGGVTANMPAAIAKQLGADYILSIDCNDILGRYSEKPEVPETYSAFVMILLDYLTENDKAADIEASDWIISPDYSGFSMMDFGRVDEILASAEKAAASEEVQAILDEVARTVGPYMEGKTYPHIEDIEAPLVSDVLFSGILPSHSDSLSQFIGRRMDYSTLVELEELLGTIKRHDGLKSVTYEVSGDVIYVRGESYPLLSGFFSMGLRGGLGVRYDGKNLYFSYTPKLSLSTQFGLTETLYATASLFVDDGVGLKFGISLPVLERSFFYFDLGLKYGQLSSLAIPGTYSIAYGRDLGLYGIAGIGYLYSNNLRTDFIIGAEYKHINGISGNDIIINDSHSGYVYAGIGLVYDIYNETNPADNGFETELSLTIGADFPESMLGYSFEASFFGVYGPAEQFKFIAEGEIATIRRPWYLEAAFHVSKTGLPVTDYLYGMLGFRIPLPSSAFIDAGVFAEGISRDRRVSSWQMNSELIPFSGINDYDIGGAISGGIFTSFGTLKATLYVSSTPRVSFMVEFE